MPGAAGGMQDNGSAISQWAGTPGPIAWPAVVGGDGYWSRIEPVMEQNWYIEGNGGRVFMSTSGPYGGYQEITGLWRSARHSPFLPYEIYKNDCPTSGCTHLIVGSSAVSETVTGGMPWVKVSPDFPGLHQPAKLRGQPVYNSHYRHQSRAGSLRVWAGQGVMANWVDVSGGNAVLPNRTILDVTTDPLNPLVGYAAAGGFEENTPGKPGHVFQVTCTADCASFTWANKTGNLPNAPINSILANPALSSAGVRGQRLGIVLYGRHQRGSPGVAEIYAGLPHAFIFDMQIDRGFTTLSVWTRSRGAFAWPLPSGPVGGPTATPGPATPTGTATSTATVTPTNQPTSTSTSIPTSTVISTGSPSTTSIPTSTATACTILFTDVACRQHLLLVYPVPRLPGHNQRLHKRVRDRQPMLQAQRQCYQGTIVEDRVQCRRVR